MNQFKVINGYDCKNNPCKLIEDIISGEQYNTENELEANSLCNLLNEKISRINELESTIINRYKKAEECYEHYLEDGRCPTCQDYCKIEMELLEKMLIKLNLFDGV